MLFFIQLNCLINCRNNALLYLNPPPLLREGFSSLTQMAFLSSPTEQRLNFHVSHYRVSHKLPSEVSYISVFYCKTTTSANDGGHDFNREQCTCSDRGSPYQNRQQQSHVAAAEDGKEDGVDHEQDVGGCQRGQQVDQTAEDQVGFVVMVFMEKVPVRHPARGQLRDGLCDTCNIRAGGVTRESRN